MRFNRGWVKLWRQVLFEDFNGDGCSLAVYMTLTGMANLKPSTAKKGKKTVHVGIGSALTSTVELSCRLGFCRSTVSRCLDFLATNRYISINKTYNGILVSVKDLSVFVDGDHSETHSQPSDIIDTARHDLHHCNTIATPVDQQYNSKATPVRHILEKRESKNKELEKELGEDGFATSSPLSFLKKTDPFPAGHALAASIKADVETETKHSPQEVKNTLPESSNPKPRGTCPDDLLNAWNTHCGDLPKATKLSGQRERAARSRLKENPSMEYWLEIIRRITASPFCTGDNDRGWRADIDWLLKPETNIRVAEGKYDDRKPKGAKSGKIDISDKSRYEGWGRNPF